MNPNAFLQDLAMLMAVAGFVSVLFTRFKWPKVIGYILAGVLLSSHLWGFSFLADEGSVQTIAQLGIIFLMFTMGLEFSTSDMRRIKDVTLPTAILDTVVMTWLGYTFGRLVCGWDAVPSIFLGVAICDSSTTLLAKIIAEMNWSRRPFVKYVIGTSVCEDIVCVGLIALVTGVAQGHGMSLGAAGMSLGGLLIFSFAVIVFGLVLVPRLLSSVASHGDNETLLLTVLGCCFFVTYVAFKLNFSLALGAFLVGVLGASSDVRRRLHQMIEPLKSMFAAVFFVSIGLLVNPAVCWRNLGLILLLSLLVMAGKGLNCFVGGLATGQSLKTSVQMGMGLAQIGEFAYMVALLYLTLTGDTDRPMYQVVVGVSLLTTLLNPVMLRASDPFGDWVERHCPAGLRAKLASYGDFLARCRSSLGAGAGAAERYRVRSLVMKLVLIAVVEFALALAFGILNERDWSAFPAWFNGHKRLVLYLVQNFFLTALLAPIFFLAQALARTVAAAVWGAHKGARARAAVSGAVRFVVLGIVLGLFFLEALMINVNLMPANPWVRAGVSVGFLLLALAGWKFFLRTGRRAYTRLQDALNADASESAADDAGFALPGAGLARQTVAVNSPAVGETVVSLNIRKKTGVNVVAVERGGVRVANFGPAFVFAPGDVLMVTGDAAQLKALQDLVKEPS